MAKRRKARARKTRKLGYINTTYSSDLDVHERVDEITANTVEFRSRSQAINTMLRESPRFQRTS